MDCLLIEAVQAFVSRRTFSVTLARCLIVWEGRGQKGVSFWQSLVRGTGCSEGLPVTGFSGIRGTHT